VTEFRLETVIRAPRDRVFDLARSVDLHVESMGRHGERAVAGVTSGLLGPGDEVTWRARHFGLSWAFTSRITAFDPPSFFRDEMARGPFARFAHDHRFEERDGETLMVDVVDYAVPFGPLGRLGDRLVLRRHLESLIAARQRAVKLTAEREPDID
jgi:ligand-binding SRPBCC domain-containing protein